MSLDTLITGSLPTTPTSPNVVHGKTALVLMGGGARTAYQAGVLKALATMLERAAPNTASRSHKASFPFDLLIGTSAGALNATYLASVADEGVSSLQRLATFWQHLRSEHVYRLDTPKWARSSRFLAGWAMSRQIQRHRALLDSTPLVNTLHAAIDLVRLEHNLQQGVLEGAAITASSYSTGVHWTFCQLSPRHQAQPWTRPDRRAEFQQISIEHLMASAAIPFLFRAVPLWVNNHKEYFGDGSMRQTSPLSSAIRLGASRILTIGVGQPLRAGMVRQADHEPTAGTIAGHAMASVFNDTLPADVEQTRRVSHSLRTLPPDVAAALPFQPVEVLAFQPSESLDDVALRHANLLPGATRDMLVTLGVLGTTPHGGGSAAALASYLLFEPAFVQALITLGELDAHARRDELLAFFRPTAST